MINLIPEAAKARVRREYIARVGVVWLFLLASVVGASLMLLSPTYVLYMRQLHAVVPRLGEESNRAAEYARLTTELSDAMVYVGQLSKEVSSLHVSEILERIERNRPVQVTIQSIFAVREQDSDRVEIQGRAGTRDSLRVFQGALRQDPYFTDAVVPVSDLAKDSDLSFTMTLTVKKQTP